MSTPDQTLPRAPTCCAPRPDLDADGSAAQARRLAALTAVALAALVAGRAAEQADGGAAGGIGAAATALYLVAYATGGYSGAVNGLAALRQRSLDVNILMLIAAAGAAAIGSWLEGGILLFLFSLSETLQTYALGRTRHAVRALMDLRPETATVRSAAGVRTVPVEDLAPGDVVVVHPGERLPADGVVLAGASDVDQATITGESVPVARAPGDAVFAATINGNGVLEVSVTKRATESTVSRIIALVAEAQATRAPTQRVIDRFGNRYAWAVILGSVATAAVPVALFGWEFEAAFYRAMTLLVVASPCALVISTPATYLAAIANAARHRVLFKGGAFLEAAADIDIVAIDKTGTLTHGRPALTDIVPLDGRASDEVLALAAAVESESEHLIARSVVDHARARGLTIAPATAARALPGIGAEARVGNRTVCVCRPAATGRNGRVRGVPGAPGNPSIDADPGGPETAIDPGGSAIAADPRRDPALAAYPGDPRDDPETHRMAMEVARRLEAEGKTAMIVSDGEPLGVLAVADTPREAARATVAALRAAGVRRIVMVTGDNAHVARAVAAEVGIRAEDVYAGLMPAEKVAVVEQLLGDGRVAFVGDGVNDAPALAASSIGIAMGAGGSDVALETADVVLMGDQFERLGHVFSLGRAARRIVKQNVAFSVAVIAVLILATLGPGIPLPLGVVGHEGSTVLVVLNGLRLLAFGGRRRGIDIGTDAR